jgi:hypothetical protein
VAQGEFGVLVGEGGGVVVGVPGGALCLAPGTIGLGEDAQVRAEGSTSQRG